jgi:hypothetical protein
VQLAGDTLPLPLLGRHYLANQGAAQRLTRLVDFLVEGRVFHRQGHLAGDRRENGKVAPAQRLGARPGRQDQAARDLLASRQGHGQQPRPAGQVAVGRCRPGRLRQGEYRPAVENGRPAQASRFFAHLFRLLEERFAGGLDQPAELSPRPVAQQD